MFRQARLACSTADSAFTFNATTFILKVYYIIKFPIIYLTTARKDARLSIRAVRIATPEVALGPELLYLFDQI